MKTAVELFELSDVREETPEQSAEARQLAETLGLKGQVTASVHGDDFVSKDVAVARFPYRLITDEELFIYGQLCPAKADVHRFDDGPIPLEVLKTVAYAKSLNDPRLTYLEVWSASSAQTKDPVLVGKVSQWSDSKIYILARWGEELLPLSVLLPDALKVWYAKRVDALNQIKNEVEAALLRPMPLGVPSSANRSIPSVHGI